MKLDNSGLVPVIALIDAFLAGDMVASAFAKVYVLLYPEQGHFCHATGIEAQSPLWWAAEDFGLEAGPTEEQLRTVASSVRDMLVRLAENDIKSLKQ